MAHTDPASPTPEAGHETSDVSISAIVKFGVGLAIVAALVLVAMWGLLRSFQAGAAKRDQPVPPLVAASLRRTPREPRLEPDPLAPRVAAQAREDAILESYGWVDRNGGIARIPIDRAMEILVERGLPPAKPMMPVMTPAPTPGPGKRETGNGKR
ncbi:MAG TPA: hypothetical protein VF958_07785 [Thermoanaerobaculia bacterium]